MPGRSRLPRGGRWTRSGAGCGGSARGPGGVRAFFIRLLVEVGVDPVPPAQAPSGFADAVAAVAGASVAAASRWPGIGEVPPWWVACAASGGRLLAPGWP
ncbi:MAG TPA: hypothetical protein VHS30_34340 [Streptosporangiaceae bacterium]|nr:hypothetical protein [Streptosporangiaceae bacterium]